MGRFKVVPPANAAVRTVSIREAAAMLGMGKDAAYNAAHRPGPDGQLWLIDGVRILQVSPKHYRVPLAQLERVLSADPVAYEPAVSFS